MPVVAVSASRTGAGKSQTTRYVGARLEASGLRTVVIRHPMPYGDLGAQRVQRFAAYADLDRARATLDEREEFEPHLDAHRTVFAGVDYEAIVRAAESEADVLLWDGGNNDFPFLRPDLHLVVVDPLRAGDETRFHLGETNVRMADAVLVNKVDAADPADLERVRRSVAQLNARADVVLARSALSLAGGMVRGRRVLVVEDGPTLTHGGMTYGAGVVAARRHGARELVDPRPFAVGSIAEVLARYRELEPLVPAMGYDPADADLVLAATPVDLARVMRLSKPVVRVRYELDPIDGRAIEKLLAPIVAWARAARPDRAAGR